MDSSPEIPDFFDDKNYFVKRKNTNKKYYNFKQTHFTVGDEIQFHMNHSKKNLKYTDFETHHDFVPSQLDFQKYQNLQVDTVKHTFDYFFNKMKKGIFVKIKDNKLENFLPFSKTAYKNEWSQYLKFPKGFKNMCEYITYASKVYNYETTDKNYTFDSRLWYTNNGIFRYENPIGEGDGGVGNFRDMLIELCEKEKVPDIEFFINKRDFPILKKDGTEPYDNIFNCSIPLLSHNYEKYSPILSNCTTDEFADIPIPTWEDWARIKYIEDGKYSHTRREYQDTFNTPWSEKKSVAVFRGSSTGNGTTIETNMRLKVAYMDSIDTSGLLDAGITNFNGRPRKEKNNEYITFINPSKFPFKVKKALSPHEQSLYKYIINIDGHTNAFRLSLELAMGSVILLVDSPYYTWYRKYLKAFVHYIPVKSNLEDLIDKIKWCIDNDEKCKFIAENAREFYNIYLCKNSMLKYLSNTLNILSKRIGQYNYKVLQPDIYFNFVMKKNCGLSFQDLFLRRIVPLIKNTKINLKFECSETRTLDKICREDSLDFCFREIKKAVEEMICLHMGTMFTMINPNPRKYFIESQTILLHDDCRFAFDGTIFTKKGQWTLDFINSILYFISSCFDILVSCQFLEKKQLTLIFEFWKKYLYQPHNFASLKQSLKFFQKESLNNQISIDFETFWNDFNTIFDLKNTNEIFTESYTPTSIDDAYLSFTIHKKHIDQNWILEKVHSLPIIDIDLPEDWWEKDFSDVKYSMSCVDWLLLCQVMDKSTILKNLNLLLKIQKSVIYSSTKRVFYVKKMLN